MSLEKLFLLLVVPIFFFGLVINVEAFVEFEDVANSTGLSYRGTSWGAYWGDFNGDNWPDLYKNNHGSSPKLYLNNQNGTFSDITNQFGLDVLMKKKDSHGASWADFDNDGDQDLLVLTGAERGKGEGSNFFLVNNQSLFQNKALDYQLDYPLGRGRIPLWFDFNGDGLLDVFLGNAIRPDGKGSPALFIQEKNGFYDFTPTNLSFKHHVGSIQISDLTNNGKMDIIFPSPALQGIFKISNSTLLDVTDQFGLSKFWTKDVAISDFNGDLKLDLLISDFTEQNSFTAFDGTKIKSNLIKGDKKYEFAFSTTGDVTFEVFPYSPQNLKIFVGSTAYIPESYKFTLSQNDLNSSGIINSPKEPGLYIGYITNEKIWRVMFYSEVVSHINLEITSNHQITNFVQSNTKMDLFSEKKLFVNTGFQFLKNSITSTRDKPCENLVSGDFDNDMDVDVYFVCSLETENLPNEIYENLGNATFISVPNIGDAAGSLQGVGDTVTTADYNNDGFLDLYLTNGKGPPLFSVEGPDQLLKNLGNDNHWIEINLEGVISNKDGIGTKIVVKTGNTEQIREQGGGMHHAAQNHKRLHFGLAENNLIDSIVLYWPSGIVQEVRNVTADQIILIKEPEMPISPKAQISLGVLPKDVLCKGGLVLVFKTSSEAACVKTTTVLKLIERGWLKDSNK